MEDPMATITDIRMLLANGMLDLDDLNDQQKAAIRAEEDAEQAALDAHLELRLAAWEESAEAAYRAQYAQQYQAELEAGDEVYTPAFEALIALHSHCL